MANELLDNLPFHRLRRRRERTVEVFVGAEGNRFVEVERGRRGLQEAHRHAPFEDSCAKYPFKGGSSQRLLFAG